MKVLHELGVNEDERVIVEVLNKIDLLEPDVRAALLARNRVRGGKNAAEQIAVSALTGQGTDDLLRLLDLLLGQAETIVQVTLAPEDGAAIAWVYANSRVLERADSEKSVRLLIAADAANLDRIAARLGDHPIEIVDPTRRRTATS